MSYCFILLQKSNQRIEKAERAIERETIDATMLQSKMRVMFLSCQAEKHGQNLPLPCKSCGQWQTRLDQHLARNAAHQLFTKQEEIEKIVNDLRNKCWEKGTRQEKNDTQDTTTVHEQ